jgi:hypothetical protein
MNDRYIKVTRLAGSELTDELIDSLLCAGEWLVRDELGYVARVEMRDICKWSDLSWRVHGELFQESVIVWTNN